MALRFPHDPAKLAPYLTLDQGGKIMAEYIWIDGNGGLRCKTTTCDQVPKDVSELKEWNFDGSSTNQAPGHDSDVYLRPCAIFKDPFRGGDNILVLCDTYNSDGSPNKTNFRAQCLKSMEAAKSHVPWFGLEQEYSLLDVDDWPVGWPKGGFPGPQGPYYCSVGAGNAFYRDIVEAHYRACLYAGVEIAGINGEVMASQWEYQVGPCEGIKMGDHLWMSRFLLMRVAEEWSVKVSFHPKIIKDGDWNGAGCHTNYSTKEMREKGGMAHIEAAIKKLETKHVEHIAVYGEDNEARLSGKHETQHIGTFSWGVANRGSSIRIPRHVAAQGYGYLEDRRPASNIDPYRVTGIIVETTLEIDNPKSVNRERRPSSEFYEDQRSHSTCHLVKIAKYCVGMAASTYTAVSLASDIPPSSSFAARQVTKPNPSNFRTKVVAGGHRDSVMALSWSCDGKKLATGGGGRDHSVKVWDTSRGFDNKSAITLKTPHHSALQLVSFNPIFPTELITIGQDDKMICFWNALNPSTPISVFNVKTSALSVAWDPVTGRSVAISNRQEQVFIYDWKFTPPSTQAAGEAGKGEPSKENDKGKVEWVKREGVASNPDGLVYRKTPGMIMSISYTPTGSHLLTCLNSGFVSAFPSPPHGIPVTRIEKHTFELSSHASAAELIRWDPLGRYFVTCGQDAAINLYSSETFCPLQTIESLTGPISKMSISYDGEYIAAGGREENAITIMSAITGEIIHKISIPGGVGDLEWSPVSNYLAYSAIEKSGYNVGSFSVLSLE